MGEQNPLQRLINGRVQAALEPTPPNETLLQLQQPFYDLLDRYWFRLETTGWERVPDGPCRVVGVHSGGALTRDAWTPVHAWHTHVGGRRVLHGTAHDVLTELLDPMEVDDDPARADDDAYVRSVHDRVEASVQAGMDRLAAQRTLPVFGSGEEPP